MPQLRGGPLHKVNAPLHEPYKPYYRFYEHEEGCPKDADCNCDPQYKGAYVLTSVQQKSRVVRHFLWQEGYVPSSGGSSERKRFVRPGAAEFLRLRKGVLQGPL